jgi:hypothetical protein
MGGRASPEDLEEGGLQEAGGVPRVRAVMAAWAEGMGVLVAGEAAQEARAELEGLVVV